MSAKPYQGVRVKVTVKEMLQEKRAREADKQEQKAVSPECVDLQKLCTSTFQTPAGGYAEPVPVIQQTCLSQPTLTLLAAPGGFHVQASTFGCVQPQFGTGVLPPFAYLTHNSNNNNSNNSSSSTTTTTNSGGFSCSPSLSPLISPPQPWSLEPSPQADYCEMAPFSLVESLLPSNTWDYFHDSPQDSFSSSSSSSSSCYGSPTRRESGQQTSFTPVQHQQQQQHYSTQDAYLLPDFWLGQPDSFSMLEWPAYDPSDYEWACIMNEMNNSSVGTESTATQGMCSNVV